MSNLVFNFKSKKIKKIKNPKFILGGKGANLAQMGKLGLPVPSGFTISTGMLFTPSDVDTKNLLPTNFFPPLIIPMEIQ